LVGLETHILGFSRARIFLSLILFYFIQNLSHLTKIRTYTYTPMIKLGKACSQLMNANNTGKTNIKVVGKYFRLTFVFNALKTPLNLDLNSL
jgi:hypothetical protein